MNWELPDVQDGFRKGRGNQRSTANICWITEKAREFQKNIYFCFIDYAKVFDCVDHDKCGTFSKRWEYQTTCLLRNLYAGQEATVRAGHGTTDWFQIGEGIHQGCILSTCFLTYMQSTSCEIPGGIQHCWEKYQKPQIWRYADDTTLMAESEEELKSLLMKVKEESKMLA